jgi:hypothetical protein
MSPFERYAIGHLSPSSLNLWRASPGLWTARYLGGLKDENAAMWRGHAVETGLARLFRGGSIGEARSAALDRFDENTAGEAADALSCLPIDWDDWRASAPLRAAVENLLTTL